MLVSIWLKVKLHSGRLSSLFILLSVWSGGPFTEGRRLNSLPISISIDNSPTTFNKETPTPPAHAIDIISTTSEPWGRDVS